MAIYVAFFIIAYLIIGIFVGLFDAWCTCKSEYGVSVWEYLSSPLFTDESIPVYIFTVFLWPISVGGLFLFGLCGGIATLISAIENSIKTLLVRIFKYIYDKKEKKKNDNRN